MKIIVYSKDYSGELSNYREYEFPDGNPEEWRGITVFGELLGDGTLDPAALNLLGKTRHLTDETDDKAQLLLIGEGLVETARAYFANGADRVFVYDDPAMKDFNIDNRCSCLMHFIDNYKPAALCFNQTPIGEKLSSRIIDRLKTVMPFSGERTVTEKSSAESSSPNLTRRGEIVICEIP